MGKRVTQEEILERFNDVHGNAFDNFWVFYETRTTPVLLVCNTCGYAFRRTPNAHLLGYGCRKCADKINAENFSLTQEEFVIRSIEKHGELYNYDNSIYANSDTLVDIFCNTCEKTFPQRPINHYRQGDGCPTCGDRKSGLARKKDQEHFLKKARAKHGEDYDYTNSVYLGSDTDVEIRCKKCNNIFWQTPDNHYTGQGCTPCARIKVREMFALTLEQFIINAQEVHGESYDYSKSVYLNSMTKVEIICEVHGSFWKTPVDHIFQKQGCPKCKSSTGQTWIRNILTDAKIKFSEEFAFEDCRNPTTNAKLFFDFHLPDLNICIEYDGIQHSEAIDYFGGDEAFKNTQIRDLIKDQYCSMNNIKLIRINHLEELREIT